jgi:hypothetical protein
MAAAILLSAGSGCQRHNLTRNGCPSNGCPAAGAHCPEVCAKGQGIPHLPLRRQTGPSGPQTATYGYPYYTIRGPRDFLLDNPPTTGL